MTCKDCFHYEACKGTYHEVKEQGEFDGEMYAECGCDDFKAKTDFVEVVRCEDCKYKDDCARQIVHTTRDYVLEQNISTYNKVHYCSYGERNDT